MMRMLLMSVLLGIHHVPKAVEQISDVVRPGARFRMPLKAKRRPVRAFESLEGPVEERNVGGLQVFRDRSGVDRKTVVLARNDDLPGLDVLHWMIRAVMAELHLQGLRPR